MEAEIIRWLCERLPSSPRVRLGPGDDAAILDCSDISASLIACDTIVEGLDFNFANATPEQIGHKVLAINLSDIAAMAACPVAATVSLVLPRSNALAVCQQLIEGMLPLAERHSLVLVGGDISIWEGPLVATVNVIADPGPGPILARTGAECGDSILVTGTLGGSLLGHHLTFEPRVEESLQLNSQYCLKAGMDVSDGLSLDLEKLAEANGLGAMLDLDAIPISASAGQLAAEGSDDRSALEHALEDGEDFELLLAVHPDEERRILLEQPIACGITCIGKFTTQQGLSAHSGDARPYRLTPRGYEHGKQS